MYIVVDTIDDASMDELYFTYADDEHVYNHAYDESTNEDNDKSRATIIPISYIMIKCISNSITVGDIESTEYICSPGVRHYGAQ